MADKTKRPHAAKIIMIAGLFCKARREGDQSDGGCPVRITKDAPEPVCPRCKEDAELAARLMEDDL